MKLFRNLAMLALVASFSVISNTPVEAANVALLPLINNVVEREDLNSIYFDRAVEAVKLRNDLDLVDSGDLDSVIGKNVSNMQLPDKAACEAIAREGNVDYVFAMQADKMYLTDKDSKIADTVIVSLRGRCVSYDAITGKYINKLISEDDDIVGSLLARYDMNGNQFGNAVTREIKKALGIKKFTIEKQRIGFKGDRR